MMASRERQTPQDYEEALALFTKDQQAAERAAKKFKKTEERLKEEYGRLYLLRERRLYALLAKKGLVICDAEVDQTHTFKLPHDQIPELTGLAAVGVFPKKELQYVYFETIERHIGDHYEESYWYRRENIYRLCPEHLKRQPEEILRFVPPPYIVSEFRPFTLVSRQDDGNFVDKNGRIFSRKLYKPTYFAPPEKVFEYFQISSLPPRP